MAAVGAGLLVAFAGIGFGLWRSQAASTRLSLARSEARFGLLLENAEDAILFSRTDGRIVNANRRAEELHGYTRAEMLSLRIHDLVPPEVRPLVAVWVESVRRRGGLVFETTHLRSDGETVPVEVASRFVEMDDEGVFFSIIRDIRERKASEARIAALNRILRTLTEVNALMVREADRERLLHGACRILVEHGGFRMVWIGLLDPDTQWLVPAAFAGHEEGYLSEVVTRADDTEFGSGPAGVCIRQGRTVAVADLAIDESFRPWREPALRRSYRSLAAVPIRIRGAVAGVLSLYSERAQVFDAEVVERIEELADDIGFALESIDTRREKEDAARALRESNTFLEAMVNSTPLAVYTLKPDGRVGTIWNPAAERMFGWSREEAIGLPLPFVPPEREDEFRALRQRVLAGESFSNAEVTRRRRDGTPIEISIATAPIRGPEGRIVDILAVVADVTDRKGMEAALRESEARFKRLAENAPDVIYRYRVAPDRGFEYVNPAITAITGYRPEEFYADPGLILRIMHPEDLHLVDEATRGVLPPGAPTLVRWFHKDGTLLWSEIRNITVRDADGRVVALEGISRDVTERVVAEQTLRQLSAAVEQSPASVMITDIAGNIEYVNPAFARLTGYTLDNVKGQNPRILKSGHIPRQTYEELWRTITSGGEWRGEMLNRNKNGELYWEFASISAIVDAKGHPIRFLAVKEDITERKKAEEALRHTQEQLLQSQKIEAVGRLAGGVAHDFNNLLGVIIGYGELARATVPPPHPARARLEQILAAALRAADLTRQLLAFSRRQVLQPRVLDLNSIVKDTERMLRRLIGEDVDLVVRQATDLGRIKADPGQVSQVLMNLAVNARDAMPGGGLLTIETANVEVDSEYARTHAPLQPGPYVQLQVKDTGVGMDEAVRQRIFEPFFTTKPEGVGTGLGLSTVYGIVKQSGGYVWVESTPGRGTTFTIHLPRAEGPAEPKTERPEVDARAKRGETILVVEDQANLREMICEVLDDNGYSVLAARDAQEALSLVKTHRGRIDLLLTDVVMPGLSGNELAGQLTPRDPALRVLYMSGYTSDIIAGHGVLPGGLQLLEKPFTSLALTRRVRQVLDEKRA
jgi:PAS domain S-box-containing protein